MRYTIALLFFFTFAAAAQPVISSAGIANAASPLGSIAPGSIFFINGTGLGAPNSSPMSLFQNTTYPLPTSGGLNGTTIQFVPLGGQGPVVLNQGTIYGIMLYESDTLLAAILPSSTQLADYNVTVTYNGQTSAPSPTIRVIQRGFGLFTFAQLGGAPGLGYGAGLVLEQNSSSNFVVDNFENSATPGGNILLFGTGLGAVKGDDSQGPAQTGVTGLSASDLQIYVGGQSATLVAGGRFVSGSGSNITSYAGVDFLEVQVPQSVQGCNVPVTVVVDGVTSDIVTTSVDPAGAYCSDPVGYSQAELQQIHTDQMAHIGTVTLIGGTLTGVAADGSIVTARNDSVTSGFANLSPQQLYSTPGYPSVGACVVIPISPTEAPTPLFLAGTPLDAGASLNLYTPDGYQQVTQNMGMLTYGSLSSNANPMIDPGAYSVDNGGGGADVGSFQAGLTAPDVPQVAGNPGATISIKQNLNVKWTGGDPNSVILLTAVSVDLNTGYSVIAECTAPPTVQQFTIPSYVLGWLPGTDSSVGFLAVQNLGQVSFQAPGLEVGHFVYQVGPSIQVQFSSGPAVKE